MGASCDGEAVLVSDLVCAFCVELAGLSMRAANPPYHLAVTWQAISRIEWGTGVDATTAPVSKLIHGLMSVTVALGGTMSVTVAMEGMPCRSIILHLP